MPDVFLADTGVVSYLTRPADRLAIEYWRILGRGQLAISFQTVAELLSADFSPRRGEMMARAMANVTRLPHSDATNAWYAHLSQARRLLRVRKQTGRSAGDADVWIAASALEHHLPLMSHDTQQVALARAAGLSVYTALPAYRAGNPV